MNAERVDVGHTPDPWAIEPSWNERAGGEVSIVNREHMRDDWDVCTVHSSEANARLIAAAPELLEAARVAEAFIAIAVPMRAADRSEAVDEVLPRLRAAIAKATGATHER
jgi:hypothetical protein